MRMQPGFSRGGGLKYPISFFKINYPRNVDRIAYKYPRYVLNCTP